MNVPERRRHERHDIVTAVMLQPNGVQHAAQVMDLSQGGARIGLSRGWDPIAGTSIKVVFQVDATHSLALHARVTRVCADHMGVEFAPAQEARIEQVLRELGVAH